MVRIPRNRHFKELYIVKRMTINANTVKFKKKVESDVHTHLFYSAGFCFENQYGTEGNCRLRMRYRSAH